MRSKRGSLILGCGLGMVAVVVAAALAVLLVSWTGSTSDDRPLAVWIEGYFEQVNDGNYAGALQLICRDSQETDLAEQVGLDIQEVLRSGRPVRHRIVGAESFDLLGATYDSFTVSVTFPSGLERIRLFTVSESGGDPCIQKMVSVP